MVGLTRCPAVHPPDLAHERDFTRDLTAHSFEVQLRFDGPCEPLEPTTAVDGLYGGCLDVDHVRRAVVELGDPFADACQHVFDVPLRLRPCGRHPGERDRHGAGQQNSSQTSLHRSHCIQETTPNPSAGCEERR
jgi:hypothetical protein